MVPALTRRLGVSLAGAAVSAIAAQAQSAPQFLAGADSARPVPAVRAVARVARATTAEPGRPAPAAALPVAEEPALAGDRPGFTTGPVLVAPGHRQVESGYSYSRAGGDRGHAIGEVLLRAGLTSAVELRVALNSYELASGPDGRAAGMDDALVAAKVRLLSAGDGPSLCPQAALLVGTSLPSGSRAFGRRASEPEALLSASWSAPHGTALTANARTARRGAGEGAHVAEYGYGASLAWPVAAHVGSYLEYTTSWTGVGGGEQRYLNTGLTLVPGHVVQLDTWTALGLHRGAPEYSLGLGVVRRW